MLGEDWNIGSAGLGALVGHGADSTMMDIAAVRGVDLSEHTARQISKTLANSYDLILVMENGHRLEIMEKFPEISGRVMLFSKWNGALDIKDPFRRERELHSRVCDEIVAAGAAWAEKLKVI
tara:strand:+ start:130 stop:495 length:366 start_codon:yes stop_codon:yes gene_type:complete